MAARDRSPALDPQLTPFVSELRDEAGPALELARAGINDRDLRRVEVTEAGVLGVLRLGFRCNQRCAMCFQGRHWPDPPVALVWTWLEELAAAGVQMLMLTGGEPTTYPELVDLVQRASRHGMEVHLQTNGVRLADEGYVQQLAAAGLAAVSVAFHAAEPSRSDGLTRTPGSHPQTVQGICNALNADLLVQLICCVEDATVDALEPLAGFIVDQLVDPFPDNPVARVELLQPGGYFDAERMARCMTPLSRVAGPAVAAARLLRRADVLLEVGGPCGFPLCTFRAAPELVPWRHRGVAERRGVYWRGFGETCGRCVAASYCMGLREEYRQIHGVAGVIPYERLPACAGEDRRPIALLRARAATLRERRQRRARRGCPST